MIIHVNLQQNIATLNTINPNLKTAVQASIDAGKKILEIYVTDFDVDYKEDESPLTQADKASNEVIMEYLVPTNIPIISEENKQLSYDQRKEWKQFWMVDPLDGTKEFIKKNGEFTVNIALIENGVPVIGVIYVPVKKELFYGSSQGAFKLNNIKDFADIENAEKIKLQSKETTSEVLVVASRSHLTPETESFINAIKSADGVDSVETVSAGSSLKICMVAEGKADVYPRYAPTMEWDVAAGHGICKAAGVKVLQAGKQEELQYNKENLLNPWFVVGDRFGS